MIKKIGIVFLVLLAIIAGALFWLRSNLDGLVRSAMVKYGSEMTQAKVSVGNAKINAVDGEGVISNFIIGNTNGFKTPYAFKVQEFSVVIDPASLTSDVILIKKITIIAPDIIYEKGKVVTNFDAIQKNIADYLGPSDDTASGGKKLIVDKLVIRKARAQAAAAFMEGEMVAFDLPDLTMRNLGKAKGGITPGELGQAVASALKKQLIGAISFDKLGNAAKAAAGTAGGAVDKIKNLF
ncbi:MAG: hypothetical protein WA123_07030 [Methylotenera sp.]